MALSPAERSRRMRLNMLMAMSYAVAGRSTFTPASLFTGGVQGAWYDPSDLTSMFQDSAGTTAAALEAPVGLLRDKSGRGNHASQSTSASRPVLSARYNLLTYTEDFSNAAWTKATGGSISATNSTTAPDGTVTADTWTQTATPGTTNLNYWTPASSITAGVSLTASICVKKISASTWARLGVTDTTGTPYFACSFNLDTGAVGVTGSGGSGWSITSASIADAGNGFYRLTLVGVANTTRPRLDLFLSNADNSGTRLANAECYVWGADLRVTNDGVGLPPYQRVGAATAGSSTAAGTADYDSGSEWPRFLRFDGTDDSLATSAIDFSATDKMSVFAGVRKLSDAAQGIVVELTAATGSNNGAFHISAPTGAFANYRFTSKGTTQVDNPVTTYTSPITNVITGLGNISAPSNIIRVNGAGAGSVLTTQGTGNYANSALYIGRRGGSTLPFNGRLTSLIVLGRTATATEITNTETWVNSKTRAY